MGKFSCICGYTTDNKNSYAAHCSHCKKHLISTGKGEIRQNKISAQKSAELQEWLAEKHTCKTCGKIMTQKFGSGVFCCRSCANKRTLSNEIKEKIKFSVIDFNEHNEAQQARRKEQTEKYNKNPKHCKYCGKIIPYESRKRKTCGDENCIKTLRHNGAVKGGVNSASKIIKRSKNEILFCNMCENQFGAENVLHNIVMFNGWDADVILLKEKIAILWNGPWHYRKIKKNHSVKQVQNRDKIKIKEIKKCGFTPYIIKDMSKKNSDIVTIEFKKLLKFLENNKQ